MSLVVALGLTRSPQPGPRARLRARLARLARLAGADWRAAVRSVGVAAPRALRALRTRDLAVAVCRLEHAAAPPLALEFDLPDGESREELAEAQRQAALEWAHVRALLTRGRRR